MIKEIDDFNGLDISWFALDKEGEIARFTSNGNGIVFLSHHHFDVLTQIDDYFEGLDESSQILDGKNEHVDFKDMSKKGLYTFDLTNRSEAYKYQRLTSPTQALLKSEIDEDILKYLPSFPLSFSNLTLIDFEQVKLEG